MQIFTAEVATNSTQSQGYGFTAEEAVAALLNRWRSDYASSSNADPHLLHALREELTVHMVELGQGYVLGSHDLYSRPIVMRGDNNRLDHIFDEDLTNSQAPGL
jgi:hypothetical protein